jgi:hypothetical protein
VRVASANLTIKSDRISNVRRQLTKLSKHNAGVLAPGEQDLFRSRLDHIIIDLKRALVKLARATIGVLPISWATPPLPTPLMAWLAILKHSYDLSESLCGRWVENPGHSEC